MGDRELGRYALALSDGEVQRYRFMANWLASAKITGGNLPASPTVQASWTWDVARAS